MYQSTITMLHSMLERDPLRRPGSINEVAWELQRTSARLRSYNLKCVCSFIVDMSVDKQPVPQDSLDETAEQLLSIVKQYMGAAEVEQVAQAIQLAQEACGRRHDGGTASLQTVSRISPLEHALTVATILAQMRIDAVGIVAGVVLEAVNVDCLSLNRVESTLGPSVSRIVGSMLRLNDLERKRHAGTQYIAAGNVEAKNNRDHQKRRNHEALRLQQAETIRRMLIGTVEDPRVVLLKFAYHLHTMRIITQHLHHPSLLPFDQQEMLTIAQETRDIYAPLAGRLGMSRVECELEDLAFQILEPDEYLWVQSHAEMESKQWRSYVERVCTKLSEEMVTIGLKAKVLGRVKHLYSFYKKLQHFIGNVEQLEDLQAVRCISQIYDLVAFRILVESTPDCYMALNHVHSLWKPKEGRVKDFIANPKTNGYRALHTTVFCMDEQLAEIQIRTFEMHEMAEYGLAIHWHYKEAGDRALSTRELLFWLRQLADWQRNLQLSTGSDVEFAEAFRDNIL